MGPGVRLRAEANLASDDRGPQIPFGRIRLGGNLSVGGPVIEAVAIRPEAVLRPAATQLLRRLGHRRDGLGFESRRLLGELGIRERLGTSP
jgi:hypothetical protein